MTSAKDIKKLIINATIETNSEVNGTVFKGLLEELDKAEKQNSAATTPGIWSTIMKSKITRLAAAAVIIVVVAVGLMHWLPGGEVVWDEGASVDWSQAGTEVKIPQELAKMPVEELLDIHFGKTASTFDSSVVAAAVAKVLDGLSARQVLAIGQKYGEGPRVAACWAPSLPPALSRIVEACDFVVHAHVDEVELDVSDLKAAILHKQRNRLSIYSGAPVKTSVQLNVLGAYPPLPSDVGEKLRFWPVFNSEHIDLLEEGKEYLIALNNHEDLFWLLQWNQGVYPVDSNGIMVANLRNGRMPLDDAWEFIMDAYDSIHYGILPSDQILNYWLAKLQSDDMTDCFTAVEYFNTLPEPIAPQELVIDAMERFLSGRIADSKENSEPIGSTRYDLDASLRRSCFAVETLDLLTQVADGPTVDRMLALYEQSLSTSGNVFYEELAGWARNGGSLRDTVVRMFRLTLKRPGPQRRERFLSLCSLLLERVRQFAEDPRDERRAHLQEEHIEELRKTKGEDIDQLLIEMLEEPAKFGISDSGLFGLLSTVLAQRALPEFGAHLERFLADPGMSKTLENSDDWWYADKAMRIYTEKTMPRKQAIQYLVDLHEQGKISIDPVIDLMNENLEPGDTEFIPFLSEAVKADWWMAPILAAEVLPDPCLVPALKEALEREEPGRGMLLQALFASGEEKESIEMALAFIQQYVNQQEHETAGKPYDGYDLRATIKFLGASGEVSAIPAIEHFLPDHDMDEPLSGSINEAWNTAIQALARLGGESAVPRLRQLYQSEDVLVRILAAVSLYYLGDDTGYELLEHFVNGTQRSLPEVEMHLGRNWSLEEAFYMPLLYLRSPHTDALLLESLHHHGFPHEGIGGTGNVSRYYAYAFAKEYKSQILPILVEQLASRHRRTAKSLLQRLTRQNFGFDADKYVLQQTEAIDRWRSYVDEYLAQPAE
jgi:HEAT repeat protein